MAANTINDETYVQWYVGDVYLGQEHYYSADRYDRAAFEKLGVLISDGEYSHSDGEHRAPELAQVQHYMKDESIIKASFMMGDGIQAPGAIVTRKKMKAGDRVEYVTHFLNLQCVN